MSSTLQMPRNQAESATRIELSVVLPTYKERANVAELIRRLDATLAGIAWEAIFVDDNSPDGTADAAKAMGVDKPAEDARCLKCHAPLAEKAPELKAEGVSCETCHGPGSGYRKLAIMKDKAEAVKNGLVLYGSPEAIKTQCLKCHDNPHGIKFDFASAWDKIKHPVPGK